MECRRLRGEGRRGGHGGRGLAFIRGWDAHPQGKAVAGLPLVAIERIGEAEAQPPPPAERPLSGVRVLDLTRVIAGPVCGRTCGGSGADLLLVTARHLPAIDPLVIDTGRGKRSTSLDLRDEARRPSWAATAPAPMSSSGLSPRRARLPRLCTTSRGGDASRHRLCVALRLWPGRPLVGQAWLQLARANRLRLQRRGSAGGRLRGAKAASRPSARSRDRIPHGLRRHDGARSPRTRGRKLARSAFARPDGAMAQEPRPGRKRIQDAPTRAWTMSENLMEESPSGFGRLQAVRHAGLASETPARMGEAFRAPRKRSACVGPIDAAIFSLQKSNEIKTLGLLEANLDCARSGSSERWTVALNRALSLGVSSSQRFSELVERRLFYLSILQHLSHFSFPPSFGSYIFKSPRYHINTRRSNLSRKHNEPLPELVFYRSFISLGFYVHS